MTRPAAATWIAEAALQEALVGLIPQARADIAQAMRLGVSRNARVFVAISMAMVGDAITSEKLADELDKTFPLESRMQRYWIPTVRALVPLQRNHPANAIEALQATSLYELAPFGPGVNGSLPGVRPRTGVPHAPQRRRSRGGVPEDH